MSQILSPHPCCQLALHAEKSEIFYLPHFILNSLAGLFMPFIRYDNPASWLPFIWIDVKSNTV